MATTATLYPSPQLPPGTSVGAYKASGWPQAQLPPSGAPVPSADTTATVGSDGSLAFTGLTDSTDYYAGASVNSVWRYVAFNTYAVSREGDQHVTVDQIVAGAVSSTDVPASTLTDQRKTVTTAGTAVQLLTASTPCKWVVVVAFKANTDAVAVGSSTVLAATGTARGVLLNPMEKAAIPIDNVNKVWLDSRVNGEGVAFLYGS
jgi:hypothetical protein